MSLLFDALYLLALVVLSPWLAWRAVRTGRYRRDLAAKLLGPPPVPNPARKPVAWFHGVSVGEIHLLVTVVAAFRKRHPDWLVVVSSTTDTGLAEARAKFDAVIPYPFDFSWACRAALRAVNPSVVVLAESELWPNFLAASASRVPVVVINARMSPRSFRRLSRLKGLAQRLLFRHVAAFAVQSAEYADRLRQLGVSESKLTVSGSVKYDGATGDRDTPKGRDLRRLLGLIENPTPRPPPQSGEGEKSQAPSSSPSPLWGGGRGVGSGPTILVAGSTHAPEEEIVLDVFARLRARFPHLRLILVPRHPDRFAEVAALVQRSGLPFVRRSQITAPLPEIPAVVLLDSVGELGAAWGLADVGYTGGSLDGKRGGQSMIEPAGYGVPTVFGPHVWNFRDAARRLVETGGAVMVNDAAELERELAGLVEDGDRRTRMGAAARMLVTDQQGATDRTLDVIDRAAGQAPAHFNPPRP
jgi:3-deoxy-D-manno-octulosonic-acid transferase